jgi:hypothetical protein
MDFEKYLVCPDNESESIKDHHKEDLTVVFCLQFRELTLRTLTPLLRIGLAGTFAPRDQFCFLRES